MGKTYTGIDIGTSGLRVVVGDGETIKDIVLETLPDGLVADGRIVSFEAMGDFIKSVTRRMKHRSKQVSFAIPQADSLARRIVIPAMDVRDLEINLPYEFRDYITQGKEKYYYDYSVLATHTLPDGTPESIELLAVAVSKQTIDNYMVMFRRAGLSLRVAMPPAAALQNLVRNNPKAQANCCLVNFTRSSTQLHFFLDGTYDVARTIEIGIADVERALADAHGVDVHVARNYLATDYQGAQDSDIARSIYERIAAELGRALNFYGFNNPNNPIDRVYIGGGGAGIASLVETVSTHIDADCRPISEIMPDAEHNAELRIQCPVAVGVTVG